jgi:hypothetical protein
MSFETLDGRYLPGIRHYQPQQQADLCENELLCPPRIQRAPRTPTTTTNIRGRRLPWAMAEARRDGNRRVSAIYIHDRYFTYRGENINGAT